MSQVSVKLPLDPTKLTPEQVNELKRNFSKPLVQTCNMATDIQNEAVDLIVSAVDQCKQNNTTYESAAKQVKEAMDRKFGPNWHCIVGEGFSYGCTAHDNSMIVVYYQGNMAILLFKC